MKIILNGETPSKKNSRINTKLGKSFPNQRFVKWHNIALSELQVLLFRKQIHTFEDKQVKLTATFYHGDYKKRDSDNQLSSILDLLVDSKILKDDCWRIIPEKHVYDKYDKHNARVEIELTEYVDE